MINQIKKKAKFQSFLTIKRINGTVENDIAKLTWDPKRTGECPINITWAGEDP